MISGVYEIVNINNGHRYIGGSVNLYKRMKYHYWELNGNKHYNPHLQNAWNKYGTGSFEFNILLYCDRDDVRMFEQRALDGLKPEYNIAPDATVQGCRLAEDTKRKIGNALKGYKHSEEMKAKMSAIMMGNNHGAGCKGKRHTEETKKKISATKTGRKFPPHSDIHKQRISTTLKGHKVSEETRQKISDSLNAYHNNKRLTR